MIGGFQLPLAMLAWAMISKYFPRQIEKEFSVRIEAKVLTTRPLQLLIYTVALLIDLLSEGRFRIKPLTLLCYAWTVWEHCFKMC